MRFTTDDGVGLHVEITGPDDADVTLVLCHCWVQCMNDWHYQVRDLQEAVGGPVRMLRYDHRGHGRSDSVAEPEATLERLGSDLSQIIDAFVPDGRIVLAGHSIGGMTVMELAASRPELFAERVAGVLFVSTSAAGLNTVTLGFPEPLAAPVRGRLAFVLARRAQLRTRLARRRGPLVEMQFVRRFLFGTSPRSDDMRQVLRDLIDCPPATFSGFFRDLMRHNRVEALAALEGVPTRVMVGDHDLLTPPRMSAKMVEVMPWSTLTVAPGAGHMLTLERHELVTGAVAEMVQAAGAGSFSARARRRVRRQARSMSA